MSGIDVGDLDGIVDSAAALFNVQDSETVPADEQPGEEATDQDDLEEQDDLDTEDDDPDDPDTDDFDDDDEDDLEDEESPEDEEEDEESDASEEDDEEEQDDQVLHTVKVQGQEFEVPLEELKAGYQRQQDYTLKTQQVSDIYNKMSQWYEQRANDPEFWVQEIATAQEDPASTIAGAIRKTGNATILLGQTVKHLVESGEIADEVVEALNLQHLAEQAKGQDLHLKVQSLEQQIQERDHQAQEQAQYAAVEQEINRQWNSLGLSFDDAQQEQTAKIELLSFARSRGIPNLHDAYSLMTNQSGAPAAPPAPQKKQKAKAAVKKRKTAAMSHKPTGGSSGGGKAGGKASADPVADAAAAALAELGLEE